MRVQLVGHEQPDRVRVGSDGLADMGDKIGFGAAWAETGRHDLSTHDIEIGDQAQCAVALVFELAAFLQPTLHGFGFRDPFKRLNTGHLITTHDVPAQAIQQRCVGIHGTDGRNLVAKGQRVGRFGFGIQPVATTVGVQRGLALKTARLNGLKSLTQYLV